jgi:DNA-directed RNA polymerase beta subunit/DNA-directed RNA polymerase beta' subunit
MRNFDINSQFDEIKKAAVNAVNSIFPIEGKTRIMELNGVSVEDILQPDDYADQAKIKSKGGTWGIPVYANLTLKEVGTNKVLDKAEKVRLFLLPKVTDRWSYIVSGNEYQVSNQLRLKPGVYTRRKQNGELKTQVNLSKGKNFDIEFDEKTSQFLITKVAGGAAKIPLYPILIHLGVSPSLVERTWGSDVAAANQGSAAASTLQRANTAFGIRTGSTFKQYLSNNTELDPETTKITLGEKFDRVDGPMLLAASKKLLEVHLGKTDPDDRDSLEFKELHSLEDFIKERLEKNKESLAWKVRRSIDHPKRTRISQIVNPGAFNSVIETFFTQDDKSSTPEQTNPLEMLSGQYRATIMGSGGIKSEHQITPEMRDVHPTHLGFLDPVHTPESKRVGANLHIPLGVVKDGKTPKAAVLDKNGKIVTISPKEAFDSKIQFPEAAKDGKVKALYRGQMVEIKPSEADYKIPAPQFMFSWSTNLIPFLSSNQGNRAMMAAKQMEQAIALKNPEAPLVQVGTPTGATMEASIGSKLAKFAPESGTIKKITKDNIIMKTDKGETKAISIYNNFPLNRKSFLEHKPLVSPGDKVKKGELLADSNFTKDGTLALGTNMRVAYLPYKGLNFEDGIVITDSAAEKLTSVHITKKSYEADDNTIQKLTTFRSNYPNLLTPQNIAKLDEQGVIKKGEKVNTGDAVIVALRKRGTSVSIGRIKKALADRPMDDSIYWSIEDSGEVVDVQRQGKLTTVYIRTEEKAKIGDKLSGRMGNKGIITKIISDSEAPRDKEGNPVEILLNPHGVISRINIGQIYESAAAKAAKDTGKPVVVQNFTGENNLQVTKKILKDAGIEDKEELFDPSGKSLGRVHVGNPYILKLYKLSTSNFSYRQGGPGHPYDMNRQPLKAGGEESAKSLDLLTMYSLLSHGARSNLKEMATTKSDQNDELWKALKSGQPLPPPKAPFVYDKFITYLKGAGIDVHKSGSKLTLAPLLDQEVEKQSSGEVQKTAFFRAKDMEPIKGGFFDPNKTGGFQGTKWGHIELQEPVVNPVFEAAIKKITGLGGKYDNLINGKLFYNKGEFNTEGKGLTGGAAVEKILKDIDVKSELKKLYTKATDARGAKLDDINKKIRYFEALDKYNLSPDKAYIRKKVPIIPPQYRPIYPLPDGNITSSDINFLYRDIGILNDMAKKPVMDWLPEEEKADLRKDIHETVKGISGLTDINIQGRPREGFISEIKGGASGQPKEGFFISKVLSRKQDFVGRGTIIPEPDLGIDEVGLPETMAWKLFEPFVIIEMKKFGKTPIQALEEVKSRTDLARKALELVMKERKVLLNRAPSLHKFSIMAFKPKVTSGTAIKIPPLVTKGFNADFDGDTMTVHVPISEGANQEADKLLPSRNLYKPGTGKLMLMPTQEAQVGIFYLSKTNEGRKELNKILPSEYKVEVVLNKKETTNLLERLSKNLSNEEFGKILTNLKTAGETHAYQKGFTLGIEDLVDLSKERDQIISVAKTTVNKAKDDQEKLQVINKKLNNIADDLLAKKLKGKNNALYDMVESGARGTANQLRSILTTPLLIQDARGNIVPKPISKSYSEGLDVSDYWTSMYGARKGMMDRALSTSRPGGFSKEIMASTIDNVIAAVDCGTEDGVTLEINDPDVMDRYLARSQGGIARNTLVDTQTIRQLKRQGIKNLIVRSPLRCRLPHGVCQKCYGIDEHGRPPVVGENIGAKAGQTISEPLVQMTMNTFHSGGTAGTGATAQGYDRIDQLLALPKIVPGDAALAPETGKITKIEKGLAGGKDVWVNNQKIFVPAGRDVVVRNGQKISAGDALSTGAIKPQDLVKYKGMEAAQEHIVDELKKAYASQGEHIHRKVFETIVRSTANQTQVLNKPLTSTVVPGDIIPYSQAVHYNENLVVELSVDECIGLVLEKNYGPFKKGHRVEEKDLKILRALSSGNIVVRKDPIVHQPILKSVDQIPLLKKDWMAALGFQNLAKALTLGAGHAWSTDLENYHPVPAFAHGVTFGQGKDGKY